MEIDYYGNNDWRDYCLAHHGIMGMHWGIRRFQPYSTTGPRKGGKTGKEIGLARRLARGIGEGVKTIRVNYKKNALKRKRMAGLKKAREIKAEKESIMKSGSAERMLKRKELFSNDEIDSFITRANKEATLENLRKSQEALRAPAENKEPKKGFFESRKEKKLQQEKDEIMKSGSIERMLENKDKFSTAEIGEFVARAQNEKNLRDLQKQISDQKAAEVANSVRRVAGFLGAANELAKEGLDLKSNVDSVKDALGVGSKKSIEKQINDAISSGDAKRFLDVADKASNDQVKDARLRFDNLAAIRKGIGENTTSNTSNSSNNEGKSNITKNNNDRSDDFKDEKPFTKSDINGALKTLMIKNGDISKDKPVNRDIGRYDFEGEKAFTKSDMNDSIKRLAERNSTATHFPKSIDRSVGTNDYSNEKPFTKSDLGNSTLSSLISKTSNQKDSIDRGRDTFNRLLSGAKEAGRSASEGASNVRAAGSKVADAFRTAANGSKGYNDAAHLGQETARQLLSGNYSKMSTSSNNDSFLNVMKNTGGLAGQRLGVRNKSSASSASTSNSSTPSKPKESVESIIQRDYGSMFDSGSVPKSSGSNSTSRTTTQPKSSGSSKPREGVESILQRDYGYMFDSGMTPKGSSSSKTKKTYQNAQSTSDYNRRAAENLKSLSKKASELSSQTSQVDDGRDYAEELLRRMSSR